MAITKNSSRKTLFIAEVTIDHADLTSAEAFEAIDMPAGAIVDDAYIVLDETFDPTTSAVIEFGITGVDTDMFVASTNLFTGQSTVGKTGNVIGKGYRFTSPGAISGVYTSGGGTATQGSLRLVVLFHYENQSDFTVTT